jgi:transcriptional regulator with XRE-family HTH domain
MRKPSKGATGANVDNVTKSGIAFGAAIRLIRRVRKVPVEIVAALAGFQTVELEAVETGKRDVTLTELRALALALGVRSPELLRVMEFLQQSTILDDR